MSILRAAFHGEGLGGQVLLACVPMTDHGKASVQLLMAGLVAVLVAPGVSRATDGTPEAPDQEATSLQAASTDLPTGMYSSAQTSMFWLKFSLLRRYSMRDNPLVYKP